MNPIFRIIQFTRQFWKWYLFLGISVVTISLLSLIGPLLSKQIVDVIVGQISGKSQNIQQIFIILGVILATDLTITTLTAISQWIGDIFGEKLQTYLSKTFYQHILDLHIGYYDNEITGRITNKMYRGIQSITDFIQNMTNNF